LLHRRVLELAHVGRGAAQRPPSHASVHGHRRNGNITVCPASSNSTIAAGSMPVVSHRGHTFTTPIGVVTTRIARTIT
jgi:hypothetical protein